MADTPIPSYYNSRFLGTIQVKLPAINPQTFVVSDSDGSTEKAEIILDGDLVAITWDRRTLSVEPTDESFSRSKREEYLARLERKSYGWLDRLLKSHHDEEPTALRGFIQMMISTLMMQHLRVRSLNAEIPFSFWEQRWKEMDRACSGLKRRSSLIADFFHNVNTLCQPPITDLSWIAVYGHLFAMMECLTSSEEKEIWGQWCKWCFNVCDARQPR